MIDTPITTRDELLQEHGDQKFVGEALAGMRMLNQFLNKGALCVGVTISVLAARQEIRADVAVVIGATAGLAAVGMNAVTQYRSPGLRRRHVERNRRIHEFLQSHSQADDQIFFREHKIDVSAITLREFSPFSDEPSETSQRLKTMAMEITQTVTTFLASLFS